MKSFKSFLKEEQEFLTEADTSKATNAEMAICVAYNMIFHENGMGYTYPAITDKEKAHYTNAIERAGVEGKEGKFGNQGLMDIGQNVANWKDAKIWGDGNVGANGDKGKGGSILVHAGASSSEATKYKTWGGSDNTSKADIRGAKPYQISLKKGGAQLMSAKAAGEAEGIFQTALMHYGVGASSNSLFEDALDILKDKMNTSAKSGKDSLIRAGASKDEFVDWYAMQKTHKRYKELDAMKLKWPNQVPRKRGKGTKNGLSKDLDTHLRAELKILGIPNSKGARNAHLKLHPDIPRLFSHKGSGAIPQSDRDILTEIEQEFAADATWTLGSTGKRSKEDIQISDRHLIKLRKAGTITSKNLVDDNLKQQIIDVIHTSATSTEWKETLENKLYGKNIHRPKKYVQVKDKKTNPLQRTASTASIGKKLELACYCLYHY